MIRFVYGTRLLSIDVIVIASVPLHVRQHSARIGWFCVSSMYSDSCHYHGYENSHHCPFAPLSDAPRYVAPVVSDFGTCGKYCAHGDEVDESHGIDDHVVERSSGSDHQGWFNTPEPVIQILHAVGLVVLRV